MNAWEKVPLTTTTVSTCHICAENFATFDECEKHVSTRHLCCMFSCPSCTQLFHTSEELNGHSCPRSEPLSLSNICEECGLQFIGMRQLLDHATVCQGVGEILYGCNGCGAKFSVSDDLDRHIETCYDNDNQQNDNQGKATEVHENSKWQPDSKTSLKPVRNPASPTGIGYTLRAKKCSLKCGRCEHVFTHEAFLSQHALYHTGVKPHLCARCGRCFEQPSQLSAHRKLMCSPSSIRLRFPYDGRRRADGTKKRPRKSVRIADPEFTILKDDEVADTSVEIIPTDSDVDTVGAQTFQTERETENIRSDHKHSPRTCDDDGCLIVESDSCRQSNDSSSALNNKVDPQKTSGHTTHRLSHLNYDRNFNCPQEQVTVNEGGTRHTKRLHNKRSSPKSVAEASRQRKLVARTFHCKLCGETFMTERFLTSHHAKNHGGDVEKHLACGECGKQFGEQFLLLAHMAVHNGIQKCETCSKLFTTVDALQMHQRVHRRKTTPVKCVGNPAMSADKTSLDSRVAAELPKETALKTSTVNETEKVDLKRCHAVIDSDSNTENRKYYAGPIRTRLLEKRPAKSIAVKRLKSILERPGKTELAQSVKPASERLSASPDGEDGGGFESDEEGMSLRIDVRSDFRCAECDKYFVSAAFLRAHTELHRVAPPGFGVRCTRCRERFDYLFEMHAHVAQQHGPRRADTAVPAVLICIKCGLRMETVNRLQLHALTHTGEMPNRCISCAQCFLSRLELEQHACTTANKSDTDVLTGRHNSRSSEQLVVSGSVVSCSSVSKPRPAVGTAPSGKTRTNQQPTGVANGSEVTAFECRECEKRFPYRYELLAHETRHTSTTQCSLCHKVFATFHQLKNHLRWHTGEMVLGCQVCDASFRSLVALRKHCAVVHRQKTVGNPITVSDRTASRTPTPAPPVDTDPEFQVQCPVCDRWFVGQGFLTTHVRLHVSGSVKPGVWFTCVHCSKRFDFQYELQTHVSLLHADMKCILCHRRFSDESSLRVDALQHTGELPYTCDSCSKSFRSESQLRSHIDSSHLVVHTVAPVERTPPDLSETNRCVSDDEQQIEID